jgi:FKBP-type peptidyl-prolyl cis-trans isomerase
MERTIVAMVMSAILVSLAQAADPPAAKPPAAPKPPAASAAPKGDFKTLKDKVSYGIGLSVGMNMKQQGLSVDDIDPSKLAAGLKDGLTGADKQLGVEEIQAAMETFQKEHAANQMAKMKVAGEKNKTEGEAFLAKNKTKPGVVTTKSGLQYQVIKTGTGKKPTKSDTISAHYHGTLVDGKVFDSSVERGKPATFEVGGVIPGWTEALQLMPVGSKWKLFIPADLAYGAHGPPEIGPNAALIFDVELLGIEAAEGLRGIPKIQEAP